MSVKCVVCVVCCVWSKRQNNLQVFANIKCYVEEEDCLLRLTSNPSSGCGLFARPGTNR